MPDATVNPRPDVLVAVPAEGAARFKREALDDVENAGGQIAEGAGLTKTQPTLGRLADQDLPRLHVAESIYRQLEAAEDGSLTVVSDPAALLSIVRCCAVACLEDLDEDLGPRPSITQAAVRSARVLAAELGVWIDLLDALTAGGAQWAPSRCRTASSTSSARGWSTRSAATPMGCEAQRTRAAWT